MAKAGRRYPAPGTHLRDTARAFWVGTSWDVAVAAVFLPFAYCAHVLVRLMAFPPWTWPWPFNNVQARAFPRWEVWAWMLGLAAPIGLFLWLAGRVVLSPRRKRVAFHAGGARNPTAPPEGRELLRRCVFSYAAVVAVLALALGRWKGGPHLLSVMVLSAYSVCTVAVGCAYRVRRHWWAGAIALALGLGLELLTTPAASLRGPQDFFEVDPRLGNPAMTSIVIVACALVSAAVARWNSPRSPRPVPSAHRRRRA